MRKRTVFSSLVIASLLLLAAAPPTFVPRASTDLSDSTDIVRKSANSGSLTIPSGTYLNLQPGNGIIQLGGAQAFQFSAPNFQLGNGSSGALSYKFLSSAGVLTIAPQFTLIDFTSSGSTNRGFRFTTSGTGIFQVVGNIGATNLSGTNTGDQIVPANTTATTSQFLTSYDSATGLFGSAQVNFGDIASTPTTLAGYGITDGGSPEIGFATFTVISGAIDSPVYGGIIQEVTWSSAGNYTVVFINPEDDTNYTITITVGADSPYSVRYNEKSTAGFNIILTRSGSDSDPDSVDVTIFRMEPNPP